MYNSAMILNPVAQRFILHWGEMGSKWGVNRTVAQVHALLYFVGKPMPADESQRLWGWHGLMSATV